MHRYMYVTDPWRYTPESESFVSSVHEILQARVLEWLPFPSPGDLPEPGIEPGSPALRADSLLSHREARTPGANTNIVNQL